MVMVYQFGFIALVGAVFLSPLIILLSTLCFFPIEWTIRHIVYFLAHSKIEALKKSGLVVIGITGSFGKSTTKSFINDILSIKFKTLSTPESVNTPLGISLITLKHLNKYHKFFIVEMGAYKRGEIAELCRIAPPDVAIITGISNQHLSLFGSQENIIKAKSEILENLSKDAVVLINQSSDFLPDFKRQVETKLQFYGTDETNKKFQGLKDLAQIPDFLKINIEPALFLGFLYEVERSKILDKLKMIKAKIKTQTGRSKTLVIDDSGTSNFKGIISALDYLNSLKYKNKVVIMPCVIELGGSSISLHELIGQKLATVVNLAIITTPDFVNSLKKGAGKSANIVFISETDKIIEKLKSLVGTETAILIQGKADPKIIDFLINK